MRGGDRIARFRTGIVRVPSGLGLRSQQHGVRKPPPDGPRGRLHRLGVGLGPFELTAKIVVANPRGPVAGADEPVKASGGRNPQAMDGSSLDWLPSGDHGAVFLHPGLREGGGVPHVGDLGGQPFQGRAMNVRLGLPPDQVHRRIVRDRNREAARLARSMLRQHGQPGTLQLAQVSPVGQPAPDLRVVDRHVAGDGGASGRVRGGDGGRWQGFEPAQGLAPCRYASSTLPVEPPPVSSHAAARAMKTRSGCGGHSARCLLAPSAAAIDHPFR